MHEQVPVSPLLASLAREKHLVEHEPDENDVSEAAKTWKLTPTEAFLEGKAAGLAQAQEDVREKAGWPVEEQSHRE